MQQVHWLAYRRIRVLRAKALLGGALFIANAVTMSHAATVQEEQILAGPCANCHGPDGRSPGAIPSIAGMPAAALVEKLNAFKSDTPPPGTTLMNRLAKGYSDAQIAILTRYYAQMKPLAGSTPGAKP